VNRVVEVKNEELIDYVGDYNVILFSSSFSKTFNANYRRLELHVDFPCCCSWAVLFGAKFGGSKEGARAGRGA
jgi:hypothetical protein